MGKSTHFDGLQERCTFDLIDL